MTATATAVAMLRSRRWRTTRPTAIDVAAFVTGGVVVAALVVSAVTSVASAPAPVGPGVSVRTATVVLGAVVVAGLCAAVVSGARGGPLALASATVLLVLQAPVDRGAVLRWPALRTVAVASVAGAAVAGVAWLVASREVVSARGSPGWWLVAGSTSAVVCAAVALLGAGLRLSGRGSSVVRAGIVLWWGFDAWFDRVTSPMAVVAHLPFEPPGVVRLAYLAVVAVGLVLVGVRWIGGLSVERAWRRSGAADQLRVALGLNDLRTAVLVLRRRAAEAPRARPWVGVRGGWTRSLPVVARSARGLARWPASRFVRFVGLAVAAGLVLGASVAYAVLGVLAAFVVYLAALDAVDALAEELDHPDLARGYPVSDGWLAARHLVVPFVVLVAFGAVAGGTAGVVAGGLASVALAGVAVSPVVAVAALAGATLTATRTARPFTRITDLALPPEAVAVRIIARVAAPVVPLASVLVPFAAAVGRGGVVAALVAAVPGGLVSVAVLVVLLVRPALERRVADRLTRWGPER